MGHRIFSVAVIGFSLTITGTVQALEIVAAVQATAEHTSNTLRTEDDEISEWFYEPGADLSAQHDTANLELDAAYSYARRIFQKDYWEDYNSTTGSGNAVWHALPERLDFTVSNTRSESTQSAVDAFTPNNRQVISTTEAGATLSFQPRSGDDLQFEYMYTDISASSTQTDSTRNSGIGRYILGLSANRSVRLETTYSDIEYDGPFPNAKYWLATIGYSQTGDQLDLDVYYGHNWYDRGGRGDTDDPSYGIDLTWRSTATSTFVLNAAERITDQSSELTGDVGDDPLGENTNTTAAFKETDASLDYTQLFGRTSMTIGVYYAEEQYADDIPLSNDGYGVRAGLTRNLTRNATLDLSADFSNRNYDDQNDEQDEIRANLAVTHRIGRALDLIWGFRYEDRSADISQSYDEWAGYVRIYYRVWGAQNR